MLRSAWGPLMDLGRFYPPGRIDSGAVEWAVHEIIAFIEQKERRGMAMAEEVRNDPDYVDWLLAEPNLLRRIMCADPDPTLLI